MSRFSGKVAIITGSSNGIGRGTALLFAKEGAQVTITGRNAERLEETRQQILKAGVSPNNVHSVVADVTSEAGQNELVNSTIQKFGKINVLVNNAGASVPDKKVPMGFGQGVETLDANLNLNIRSVVGLTNKVVPHLAATKGEIVNISSITSGPHGHADASYYSVAKAALDKYTRNSALSLIDQGIRVNSISPGLVLTGFLDAMGMPNGALEKSTTRRCPEAEKDPPELGTELRVPRRNPVTMNTTSSTREDYESTPTQPKTNSTPFWEGINQHDGHDEMLARIDSNRELDDDPFSEVIPVIYRFRTTSELILKFLFPMR